MSLPNRYLSVRDYLAGERESAVRHEYVDGQTYAMAGASDRHNRIALNISSRLNSYLDDGRREVFMSDMKIKVDPVVYYYPDVVVTCDEPVTDPYTRAEPRLVFEVISPTTERIDRREKMLAYKRVESLQEYVLVLQDRMQIEVYRKRGGEWQCEVFMQPELEVNFDSVGLTMTVAEIYRNVRFSAGGEEDS